MSRTRVRLIGSILGVELTAATIIPSPDARGRMYEQREPGHAVRPKLKNPGRVTVTVSLP